MIQDESFAAQSKGPPLCLRSRLKRLIRV